MKTPLPKGQRGQVLVDWVVDCLRKAIMDGHFQPGERLDQDLIARELQVSLTPVRESIRQLANEGFVEVRPCYGAFIAQVSRDSIRKIYDVRCLLEAEVVRQVTPLIPDSVLKELDRTLFHTREESEAGNLDSHYAEDLQFHETILGYCENEILREVLDALRNRTSVVRRFAQVVPGPHFMDGLQEHRAVLDAMRRRCPNEAAELMRLHLERSAVRLQSLMQVDELVPSLA